tara:strand:- start:190 stop:360 length:171 start_codon:yes stop_codon:yes gene_type:complete
MDTIENSLAIIWEALDAYAETCLGNKLGQDENNMEYAEDWAELCEAMANLTERLRP